MSWEVSKVDKSKDFNDKHEENILNIFVTLEVINLLIFNDVNE